MVWCCGVQANNVSTASTLDDKGRHWSEMLSCIITTVTNSCRILLIQSLTGAECTLQT
jgi:hypothetical protein